MLSNRKLLFYGIVLGSMLLGRLGAPQLNVLICSGMATWIVFNKRLDFLPLLLLCNLPITAFNIDYSIYRTFESQVEVYTKDYINIAGLPISAGLVTVVAMAAVCGWNLLNRPEKYYRGAMAAMFVLWIVGALVSLLIGVSGKLQAYQAWSGPLRGYLSLIGVFYGYAIAVDRPQWKSIVFRDLLIFFLIIGALALPGFFYHRIMFVGVSVVPAMAMVALTLRRPWSRLLGLANLIVWFLYAIFVGSTFTLLLLFMMSAGLSGVVLVRMTGARRILGILYGVPMIIAITTYMFVAIIGTKYISLQEIVYEGGELTFSEEILFKIFDDRAQLWVYILDDIKRDNLFMPVPGEDLAIIHPKHGEIFVRHGAHNSYLQALRENGVIAGGIIIIIMAYCLIAVSKSYGASSQSETIAWAAGALPTLTVGAVTGHYVIGQLVGAFIFLFVGMAIANVQSPGRRRGMRRR
jgi:hypothetical protein